MHLPVTVEPVLRERRAHSCDTGRPKSTLAREFPRIDFQNVPEVWWTEGNADSDSKGMEPLRVVRQRVTLFKNLLSRRPEKKILVVGHAEFFFLMLKYRLKNCQLMEWRADQAG